MSMKKDPDKTYADIRMNARQAILILDAFSIAMGSGLLPYTKINEDAALTLVDELRAKFIDTVPMVSTKGI